MAQLVDRNLAVDLTPMLATIPDLAAAGYTPSVLNLGRFGGRQYAMAFLIGSPVLYFNLDLVKRAGGDPQRLPGTWEEAIALAARIRALGPEFAGIYYSYLGDWQFQNLVSLMGSPMMDEDRQKLLFDGPAGLAAMRTIGRFVTEGGMRPMARVAAQEQFATGTLGMLGDVGPGGQVLGRPTKQLGPLGLEVLDHALQEVITGRKVIEHRAPGDARRIGNGSVCRGRIAQTGDHLDRLLEDPGAGAPRLGRVPFFSALWHGRHLGRRHRQDNGF
jgi:hypothetical protein